MADVSLSKGVLDAYVLSGNEVVEFKLGTASAQTFKLYKADVTVPGFIDYHARMESFILWFIDAASYIDSDDEKWEYFVLHEKKLVNGKVCYPFAGYATIYRYYAYPSNIRPRIRWCTHRVVHNYRLSPLFHALRNKNIPTLLCCTTPFKMARILLTVEDPSSTFIRLRDFVDCKNCLTLPSYSRQHLHKGFSEEMRKEAQEKFKLNKRQKADVEKLQRTMSPEEFEATMQCLNAQNRIEQLESQYRELELEYRHTLERLAACQFS
ncbi:hypothetical protein HPB47_010659 [Ixodes persulcatus]|uniref:Uncharacterized protein n=1 Tax=Ixodes persulcatus TaxID=34615 RepID=A0AC60NYR4_IXOPE|nr:hypothetical protein HPB47_010659 [Ixodes persulcatus]